MDITSIPLLSMLRSRMGYFAERQRIGAENVANSSTPGYRPRDLAPFRFQGAGSARRSGVDPGSEVPTVLRVTHPAHQAVQDSEAITAARGFRAERKADFETTLDGNQISLEDQMLRMADSRVNYEAAIGFYQKSMTMIRAATRAPGR
ncbi:MAG: flagellar basal body rod protein FlgB [Phenylobacterium sp.]|nr:flagellar basal body rod protein FlgB [Phenylobacterium sp.]MCA6324666.1 flagellar basal body rod protein FlgB [Phenylobacterium sp.]MCA6336630.1 flagellar basal body rod protein FlgB [Phenylobacterium sp.]MCA6340644.1 flagellar basal body rod protein FlgB [Phenylobacterium sp.]MCA6341802.1 flagellar basal body rod protein FlgB [Phenylobacterium sp.]